MYTNAKPLLKWVSKSSIKRSQNKPNSKPDAPKKNVPTATVAPSRRQIPSIIIVPGTPKVDAKVAPVLKHVEENTPKAVPNENIIVEIAPSMPEIVLSNEVNSETNTTVPGTYLKLY